MKALRKISIIEINRNINKVNILSLLCILFFSTVILQISIDNNKIFQKQKNEFINTEKSNLQRYFNYIQYGLHGFRVLFEPTPFSAIFENSSTINGLEVSMDCNVMLRISNPRNDKSIFMRPTNGNLDLSWFLLIVVSLLVMFWGWFTFKDRKYLQYLLNFSKKRNIFLGMILAKVLLLIVSISIITISAYVQFLLNGLKLDSKSGFIYFVIVATLIMFFLLIVSASFGATNRDLKGGLFAFMSWLIIVIMLPELMNIGFSRVTIPKMKSVYKHQYNKTSLLSSFEKRVNRKSKELESRAEKIKLNVRLMEEYWKNDFKKIVNLELEMIEGIVTNKEKYHLLSIFSPVTFYNSVNNELSSKGFNSFLEFYRSNVQKYKGFVRFYLDNRLNPNKVESFLKDHEYTFVGKSSLPHFFGLGIALNLFYILVALFISYYRFNKLIYDIPESKNSFSDCKFEFYQGKYHKLEYTSLDFPGPFYNHFSGKEGFSGEISIDGKPITHGNPIDFAYIPGLDQFPPETKALRLLKTICGLSNTDENKQKELKEKYSHLLEKPIKDLPYIEGLKFLISLSMLKNSKVYILHDFLIGLKESEVKQVLEDLKNDENIIIELGLERGAGQDYFDHYLFIHSHQGENLIRVLKE